ncbi:MAG: MAPEG family protein [Pseudomonadota bacterium]
MGQDILKPVVVLIAWTLVMWAWMVVVRLPAMKAAGIDLAKVRGSKPGQLDSILAPEKQWPAHNYMHLMEQPTIFYAIAVVIAMTATGDGFNAWLGWGYVTLRIAHSIVQATFNRISVRFALFLLSTLCLIALTLHAAMAVFHG